MKKTFNSLLHEIVENHKTAKVMVNRLDDAMQRVEKEEDLAPLPTLSDSAYVNARNTGILIRAREMIGKDKWKDLIACLQPCYREINVLNYSIRMREQLKLLTLPLGKEPNSEISEYVRTETLKFLKGRVANVISLLENAEEVLIGIS